MQQPRKEKKALKEAFRKHDPDAARLLLAHSVALGHDRLAVRRYLAARYLGCVDLEEFRPFCLAAARRFRPDALMTSARTIAHDLHLEVDVHEILSELMPAEPPLVLPFSGIAPQISNAARYCGGNVSLIGRLEMGAGAWLGPDTVIRGDGHFVRIGDDLRIGERGTVHIAHERYPTIIGNRVTAGHNVVIHACTVGDDCVFEDDVVILDGSVVEDNVLIEAGSIVYPRSTLQAGWIYAGSPAKPVRELTGEEREGHRQKISDSIFLSIFREQAKPGPRGAKLADDVFIGGTVVLEGAVEVGEETGVFFGCKLYGHEAGIRIGRDCNIQDNSIIDASAGAVTIGANVTIGHNVDLYSCTIGDNSLIGIGSRLGERTIVENDVLLAGGSTTEPGQRLERGWLWGGRPARALAPLDDAKRGMMAMTIVQYRAYGIEYDTAQKRRLPEGMA